MANEYRVTSVTVEAMHGGTPAARVSQHSIEVMHGGNQVSGRVSLVAVEVLRSTRDIYLKRRDPIAN